MAETLTESFCERCGTRYEFKAPTRLNPLRKTRGLIGGLKNYVMSQDALGDAVGDAMRSEEERLAAAQLEAFHESFNFCIDCRQYTCLNCWNDDAGRCRSCAPIPGTDDLADRLAASVAGQPAVAQPLVDHASHGSAIVGPESWPTSDLPEVAATNGHVPEGWPAADGFVYESQPDTTPARSDDGFVYDAPDVDEVAAAFQSAPLVAQEAAADPEPVVAYEPEPEPEPVVAYEPEPEPIVAYEAEPEPEPLVAYEPEPEPVVAYEPEPEPVAASAPDADNEAVSSWAAAELDFEPPEFVAEEAAPIDVEVPELAVTDATEPEQPHLRVVAWDEDAAYDLEPEPIATAEVEVEPVVAEELEPLVAAAEPEPEPVVAIEADLEPEPVVAQEPDPEPVFAQEPDQEPVVAREPEPEPVVAQEPEPEPVAAEAPAPVAADEPAAPEPVAPHRIAPISETILRFPERRAAPPTAAPAAAEDDTPEIAARRAQLDLLGLGDPGEGPVQPNRPSVVPYRSRGATPTSGELAARAAAATGTTFWEASAREVAGAAAMVGVQSCGQCGLSLSANARFCRRCGTRQAQSA